MIGLAKKNPAIMVTGAAGFIGCHVCRMFLEKGYDVLGIDNLDHFYPVDMKRRNIAEINRIASDAGRLFQLSETDIRDTAKMRELFSNDHFEAVVHLAARVSVRASVLNPELYTSVNVDGTANLLECMKESGARRLIFASSSSIYGDNCRIPFSESDASLRPISPYAVTKKIGEELCYVHHRLYGMNTACLRFFTVYGPNQRPDLAIHKFVGLMLQGKAIPVFGDGRTSRDYTYISDIIKGIYQAFLWTGGGDKLYNIFNLGRGNPVSLMDMINTIADELHVKPMIEYAPRQPEEVFTTYADISRAEKFLAYKPETAFREGIEMFVDWYKNRDSEK